MTTRLSGTRRRRQHLVFFRKFLSKFYRRSLTPSLTLTDMSSNDAAFHTAEPAHLGGELMLADADHVEAWLLPSVLEATGLEPAEPASQITCS